MLLDDRILFPGAILAGFAKLDLARRMKDLRVFGLMSRGCNNIALAVSKADRNFLISVRFTSPEPGVVYVTTVHRRNRVVTNGFPDYMDERREFVEQDPPKRLYLKASRAALHAYHEKALADCSWDKAKVAEERRAIEASCKRLCLGDSHVAVAKGGYLEFVVPTVDFTRSPEKLKALPMLAA